MNNYILLFLNEFRNSSINYEVFDNVIHNQEEFEELKIELQKTIELGAYPFFEKYDSLEKVFEETEYMNLKEIMQIITQPLPHRRLIIKGLHNKESYLSYYEQMLETYSNDSKAENLQLIFKIKELVDKKMGY